MNLARELHRTRAELEQTMSAAEMAEWRVFFGREWWPEDRADYRMGKICSTIAGANGVTTKPSDFIPDRSEAYKPEQTEDDIKRIFQAATIAMGGTLPKGC